MPYCQGTFGRQRHHVDRSLVVQQSRDLPPATGSRETACSAKFHRAPGSKHTKVVEVDRAGAEQLVAGEKRAAQLSMCSSHAPHSGLDNAGAGSNLAQLTRIEYMQLVERLPISSTSSWTALGIAFQRGRGAGLRS